MDELIVKVYLMFDGRMNRMNFFTYSFVMLVAFTLVKVIEENVHLQVSEEQNLALSILITCAFMFVWAVWVVRRLHDLDMPGKHIVGMTIPLYNFYLLALLFFLKGTDGENRYGADSVLPRVK